MTLAPYFEDWKGDRQMSAGILSCVRNASRVVSRSFGWSKQPETVNSFAPRAGEPRSLKSGRKAHRGPQKLRPSGVFVFPGSTACPKAGAEDPSVLALACAQHLQAAHRSAGAMSEVRPGHKNKPRKVTLLNLTR